jgi:exopolyphosphatase/guanosine-5'-triphosphate,3'-diphosphate pyrophosphatase
LPLYLVRHAKAYSRSSWVEADSLRPLTPAGVLQARSIATALEAERPVRLISSPAARCHQTLEPLARQLQLRIELDPQLSEGGQVGPIIEMLDEIRPGPIVLCSHGDVIPKLLRALAPEGLDAGPIPCKKGSFWRVERKPAGTGRATYWLPRPPSESPADAGFGGPDTRRIAALDLGSSSFHLLVADVEPGGTLHRVGRERVMLRLGAMLMEDGQITAAARARAVETVAQMRWDAEQAGADLLLPVATAALRDATNGAEVVDALSDALGMPVRLLSGEEEARLIFRALRQRLDLTEGVTLGMDLGGGSLELAIGDAERVIWERTVPVGTVRLHGERAPGDPMKKADADAIRARVRGELEPLLDDIAGHAPERVVAIGGTVRNLFRLVRASSAPVAGRLPVDGEVAAAELAELADRLSTPGSKQRLALPAMSARRVDLLPTGAVIVATIAEMLGVERIRMCDWGLREGVMLEAIQQGAA